MSQNSKIRFIPGQIEMNISFQNAYQLQGQNILQKEGKCVLNCGLIIHYTYFSHVCTYVYGPPVSEIKH